MKVGETELARDTFKGRSAEALSRDLRMPELVAKVGAGETKPLTFSKQGTGTLFYVARLQYASDRIFHDSLDKGFAISRRYAPIADALAEPQAPGDDVQGRRSDQGDPDAGDSEGATVGGARRSDSRRLRAGRILVPDDRRGSGEEAARRRRRPSRDWRSWWERGGFDHVERHDDRVMLFATRLSEGTHEFSYIVRATTAGTFKTAPAHVEEMYEPEVFGRTGTVIVEVKR